MKIYSKNKLTWIFGCFLAIIFITGFNNLAQSAQDQTQQCRSDNGWCLEVALPGLPSGQPIKEPGQYIRLLYLLGVGIAGVLAVLIIVYAGFQWMTSPAVGTIENAKQMITNAISGIIILLSSYLILNTINPDLVSLKMPELEKLTLTKGGIEITKEPIEVRGFFENEGVKQTNEQQGSVKCPNCISTSQAGFNVSKEASENQYENDRATPERINDLKKIQTECRKLGCSFYITAAWDLAGHDVNSWHKTGQAVDIVPSGSSFCGRDYDLLRQAIKQANVAYLEEDRPCGRNHHFHISPDGR